MEIMALIISTLALILSLIQFIQDASRQKKEATLIAYNELQDDVFSELNKYNEQQIANMPYGEEWEQITTCLAKLERFSVGIATGIYSIDILNRLGGAYYIRQFEKLKPIIIKKRNENISPGGHYDEFESIVDELKKMRQDIGK